MRVAGIRIIRPMMQSRVVIFNGILPNFNVVSGSSS